MEVCGGMVSIEASLKLSAEPSSAKACCCRVKESSVRIYRMVKIQFLGKDVSFFHNLTHTYMRRNINSLGESVSVESLFADITLSVAAW